MQKTPLYFTETKASDPASPVAIPIADLEHHAQDWLFDGQYRNHSKNTIVGKRDVIKKLMWFLRLRGYSTCGVTELRQFLAYIATGHLEPGGRWGNPRLTKPVKPRTVAYYYVYLQGLFRWLVAEGVLPGSPLERIAKPVARSQQVQGFTQEQVQALLAAAQRSLHPRRNTAIIYVLFDTGIRVSELCGLRMCDLELSARRLTVLGKGSKRRDVHIGRSTAKAVFSYLREHPRTSEDLVFLSDRCTRSGEHLTRSGVLQLIERLGRAANIQLTRASPHTFRHTFAIEFLRNGGDLLSLKALLGHATLSMTSKYIALAQADIANQHRLHSPADRLKARPD